MEKIGPYLVQAVLALFSFFVVAPCILNSISTFGVQKRFAKEMIDLGVVKEEDVQMIQPKKQIMGVVISAIVLGAIVFVCIRAHSSRAWVSYVLCAISLALGVLRYRSVLQFNSLTVKRFRNAYRFCMNADKYNAYVDSHF